MVGWFISFLVRGLLSNHVTVGERKKTAEATQDREHSEGGETTQKRALVVVVDGAYMNKVTAREEDERGKRKRRGRIPFFMCACA